MPEGLISTGDGNYLEIRLTATDSNGLSKTVTREVQPNRVDVSFATNPSGLSLLINGETFTTPKTLVSWEGYRLNVNAPSPQTLSGKTYVFSSWSDGKGQQHAIVTGAAPSTYTAAFKACTNSGTSAAETLRGTSAADVICGLGGNDTIEGRAGDDDTHWWRRSRQGDRQRWCRHSLRGERQRHAQLPRWGERQRLSRRGRRHRQEDNRPNREVDRRVPVGCLASANGARPET